PEAIADESADSTETSTGTTKAVQDVLSVQQVQEGAQPVIVDEVPVVDEVVGRFQGCLLARRRRKVLRKIAFASQSSTRRV
ncbi:MAG: hypothetical protein JHC82_02575, partial [Stenotrophomonas sp.]|nr:hypothetical protein [Stenotrophomonas sp.]